MNRIVLCLACLALLASCAPEKNESHQAATGSGAKNDAASLPSAPPGPLEGMWSTDCQGGAQGFQKKVWVFEGERFTQKISLFSDSACAAPSGEQVLWTGSFSLRGPSPSMPEATMLDLEGQSPDGARGTFFGIIYLKDDFLFLSPRSQAESARPREFAEYDYLVRRGSG